MKFGIVFLLLLTAPTVYATDYFNTFKNMYEQVAQDPGAAGAVWKSDFEPGAYSHCATSFSRQPLKFVTGVLGTCSFTTQDAGPAVPSRSYEAPCASDPSSPLRAKYGFQETSPSAEGWVVEAQPSVLIVRSEFDSSEVRYRKSKDYLVFRDLSYAFAGYCWQ